MTMNKRIIFTVMLAFAMLFSAACSNPAKPTIMQSMETFATTPQSSVSEVFVMDDPTESITLTGSEDDSYTFSYDSDVITYSGQGGNFFLVGSNPTECYLHIMVQSGTGTFEEALKTASGRIAEEYVLDSGRKAVCYKTNDASIYHIIIEANDLVSSGDGIIKITIGSADKWLYSRQDIANMVDNGF